MLARLPFRLAPRAKCFILQGLGFHALQLRPDLRGPQGLPARRVPKALKDHKDHKGLREQRGYQAVPSWRLIWVHALVAGLPSDRPTAEPSLAQVIREHQERHPTQLAKQAAKKRILLA